MTNMEISLIVCLMLVTWVALPAMYYLGMREGRAIGFRRGLPLGALAWVIVKETSDTGETDDKCETES